MIRLSLVGAPGRMGGAVLSQLESTDTLVEAVEKPGSSLVGQPVVTRHVGFTGSHNFVDCLSGDCDVVVDFAAGEGLKELVSLCAQKGWALVSGRTGISTQDDEALSEAAQAVPVLHSGNMSLGASLLALLVAQAARALPQADIEILEAHHVHKKDAPSGTALMLADAAAAARGLNADVYVYGRNPKTGVKEPGTIGIHALRSGETVGEHAVWLGVVGERLELKHVAQDRAVFARGALTAARWLVGRKAGRYSLRDVLDL